MKYYEDLNLICKRLNIKNIITNDIDAWTCPKKNIYKFIINMDYRDSK